MFKKTMTFAMLTLLGTAPALAHEGRSPEAQKEWKAARVHRLADKLGLDATGEAKLNQIFQKFRAQAEPLRQDVGEARQALKQELEAATPDEARVSALSGRLQSAREQMRAIAQQRSAELKAALTPTQYAKLMMGRHHFGRGFHKHDHKNESK